MNLRLCALGCLALFARSASAATCAFSSGATTTPPSGQVAVTILSMKLNTDMEDDDNYIPGYDDRADVYGKIEINADGTAESFSLPKIDESDFPHWPTDNRFVSRPTVVGQNVHVVIRLREADWYYDDTVDTSPDTTRDDLEFDFNTCSLTVSGDVNGNASSVFEVTSGTGWNQGTLSFQVGMADGRALSGKSDVVLSGFDLVQVLPQVGRLVAKKPTVGLVTVANNTSAPQPVSVRLQVVDATNAVVFDATESLGTPLGVGEVRSKYLATAVPFLPPDFSCKPNALRAIATLVLPAGAETSGDPKTACWLMNNSSGTKSWSVVTTRQPSLTWIRTGRLLDVDNLASMTQLHNLHDIALPFIRGVYPTAGIDDSVSSFSFVPPLSGLILDFFTDLLAGVGIPADAAIPYAIVYELSASAALVGIDRLMGVLPKGWFGTLYRSWGTTNGLSLGEWHPHAVIFESVSPGPPEGLALVTPGHELGHTYGLSLDPSIKSWACRLAGDLGVIACGISSGFDEYHSASHPNGVPTWGYWVPQGSGPLTSLTGEQCDSNCMMGPAVLGAESNWVPGAKRWIDGSDYDRLVDKLTACNPAPTGTLFVSGIIDGADRATLGWTFAQPGKTQPLDFADKAGEVPTPYTIALLDAKGTKVSESELPLNFNHPETDWPIQATVFGGYVSFPVGTAKIQLWNRTKKLLLAERAVSLHAPVIAAPTLSTHVVGKERFLDIAWKAGDADKDVLTHFIHISPDRGVHWWPLAHALTSASYSASLAGIPAGSYVVRVSTSDGVNVSTSQSLIAL